MELILEMNTEMMYKEELIKDRKLNIKVYMKRSFIFDFIYLLSILILGDSESNFLIISFVKIFNIIK